MKISNYGIRAKTFRTVVSATGQIKIPETLHRRCGLKPKTRLVVSEQGGKITLTPVRILIEKLCGSLHGAGTLREFLEERAQERKLEEERFMRLSGKAHKST